MTCEQQASRFRRGRKVAACTGAVVALTVIVGVAGQGTDLASLAGLGYPGIILLMFLSSSTVLFPAPGFASVSGWWSALLTP